MDLIKQARFAGVKVQPNPFAALANRGLSRKAKVISFLVGIGAFTLSYLMHEKSFVTLAILIAVEDLLAAGVSSYHGLQPEMLSARFCLQPELQGELAHQ